MEPLIDEEEAEVAASRLSHQVLRLLAHTALAVVSWLALMMLGYALNPPGISQLVILLLSTGVPLLVGFGVNRVRQDELAGAVWVIGFVWLLIVCLWILDMPTGQGACLHCDATEKLTRTFFSFPTPSGLIDNDGPFVGTWPTAALIGYGIGARLALRRKG